MSLSKDYVSDSESEDEGFTVPKHYTKLTPSKLPKKEVWLIKAPKGFDFKSLKYLPVSFNPSEDCELSGDYKIQEDLTDLVSEGSKFKLIGKEVGDIKKFYNIRQSVKIPGIKYEKVVKQRKNIKKVNGLKKQHFATGYSRDEGDETSDLEGEHDVEMVDETEKPAEKKTKKDKKEKKEKKERKDKKEKKEKKSKK
jgi:DNA-directed RNA polymerase I subunit RPA34